MEEIQKEMFRTWRSSWDVQLKTLSMFQEQGEKMLDMLFTQADIVNGESKKVVKEWLSNAKEAQKGYLKSVDDNLNKIEALIISK